MHGHLRTSSQNSWAAFGAVLRMWRDRRELSLRTLADRIKWDHSVIARWEQGKNPPTVGAIKALENALDTGGEITAAALHAQAMEVERLRTELRRLQRSTLPSRDQPQEGEDDMERRAAMQLLGALSAGAVVPDHALHTLLSSVDRMIGDRGSLNLDDWELIVQEYAFTAILSSPGDWVSRLTTDLAEAALQLGQAKDQSTRSGLQRIVALLAAHLSGALGEKGDRIAEMRARRTARHAADASGDKNLAVWIRAKEAEAAFWQGNPPQLVLKTADDAIRIADGLPSLGLAHAHKVRAWALASHSTTYHAEASRATLNDLFDTFEQLPDSVTSDRLSDSGFSEGMLRFGEAYVHTLNGDTTKANRAIEAALPFYPPKRAYGIANLHSMQALNQVHNRDIAQGLNHALTSGDNLPYTRARRLITTQILKALPEKARALPTAQELRARTA